MIGERGQLPLTLHVLVKELKQELAGVLDVHKLKPGVYRGWNMIFRDLHARAQVCAAPVMFLGFPPSDIIMEAGRRYQRGPALSLVL